MDFNQAVAKADEANEALSLKVGYNVDPYMVEYHSTKGWVVVRSS